MPRPLVKAARRTSFRFGVSLTVFVVVCTLMKIQWVILFSQVSSFKFCCGSSPGGFLAAFHGITRRIPSLELQDECRVCALQRSCCAGQGLRLAWQGQTCRFRESPLLDFRHDTRSWHVVVGLSQKKPFFPCTRIEEGLHRGGFGGPPGR